MQVYNDRRGQQLIRLPNLNKPYIKTANERIEQTRDNLLILFDSSSEEDYRKEVFCNIDYNDKNGLQGIELILANCDSTMEVAGRFIKR